MGGPLYLILMFFVSMFHRPDHAQYAPACEDEEVLPVYLAQALAAAFVLPWTALGCTAVFCLGRFRRGTVRFKHGRVLVKDGTLSFAAAGIVTGICFFVGIIAFAHRLGL